MKILHILIILQSSTVGGTHGLASTCQQKGLEVLLSSYEMLYDTSLYDLTSNVLRALYSRTYG